ncbi:MAG: GHKL domain-containing protein, partial [Deltaproteobacteria bacterium]|nr:GHKL domain-containing protein [Deltaproteobacteria bacterium]
FSHALIEDYAQTLDDKGRDYLRRIRGASQSMSELIDDLLQLSRVTRSEIKYEKTDLTAMALGIVAELKSLDPEHKVETTIERGLSAVGDANLLRMVLFNLFENAWKFSSKAKRPRIAFTFSHEERGGVYSVCDNGVGFDQKYADKLFVPFQRLHSVTEYSGTGIGLATVRRIINRHGGQVWAEGRPNGGASFYFTL